MIGSLGLRIMQIRNHKAIQKVILLGVAQGDLLVDELGVQMMLDFIFFIFLQKKKNIPQLVNFVDTRFCTHDFIKEDDWNDHLCIQKIMIALHALIHSLHVKKMFFTMVCSVSKSDRRIERYHMIKFARSTCIMSRQSRPHMIDLN